MDFQRILFEYVTLARQFESLAADVSLKLVETIQAFNSLVCDEILGGAAFNKKKIKHITSKHLGKLIRPLLSTLTKPGFFLVALASNCISFVIDEVPFI